MQLQISEGPTHFCFHWVSPQTTQAAFLLSAAVTPRGPEGCGGFVFSSLPQRSPDKEANLYPLLLPLVTWKSFPIKDVGCGLGLLEANSTDPIPSLGGVEKEAGRAQFPIPKNLIPQDTSQWPQEAKTVAWKGVCWAESQA